jgi:hypothetical protein
MAAPCAARRRTSVDWQARWLLFALPLVASLVHGCSAPTLVSPDAAFETADPQALRVGAAAIAITPPLGTFLAGGIPYRPAVHVHDPLWARAIVLDDGTHRIALVALDLLGMTYDDVVRIRGEIAESAAVDYVLLAFTHTHSAPDLIGAWAPQLVQGDTRYRKQVGQAVSDAVVQASAAARPAKLRIAVGDSGTPPLTRDTRAPDFIDDTLTVWQALDIETEQPLVTVIHYATHPTLVPSLSWDVSSDFVHYLREALENGMPGDDGPVDAEGGLCVFFNGALGGRIAPAHAEPLETNATRDAAYQCAQGYGYRLARRVQWLLRNQASDLDAALPLAAASRQVQVPLENKLIRLATTLGVIERAVPDGKVNSEVAIIHLGPIELFAVPGLIFPELVRGGFGPIAGSDFPDAAPESPALAELSHSRYFIVIGIASDMLGDIIPRALWDERPPYTSRDGAPPYGEVISPGPATAQVLLDAFEVLAVDGGGKVQRRAGEKCSTDGFRIGSEGRGVEEVEGLVSGRCSEGL